MKTKKPYIDADTGLLVIGDKKYEASRRKYKKIDGIEHTDKITFKEFDVEEHDEKVEYIIKKIEDGVTKQELIKELMKHIPSVEIDKAYKALKKRMKPRKQSGCLGFKIGNKGSTYLELVGGVAD